MMPMKFIMPALLLLSLLTACKSTSVATDPVNEATLSNVEWQMQELHFLQQNTPYFYKRGSASANNMNLDNDFIKFNNDGTGVYHQTDGVEYPLKWYFADVQKTAIEYSIENFRGQQTLNVHWEQIELSKKTLKYIEYKTTGNNNNTIAQIIRTSKL